MRLTKYQIIQHCCFKITDRKVWILYEEVTQHIAPEDQAAAMMGIGMAHSGQASPGDRRLIVAIVRMQNITQTIQQTARQHLLRLTKLNAETTAFAFMPGR